MISKAWLYIKFFLFYKTYIHKLDFIYNVLMKVDISEQSEMTLQSDISGQVRSTNQWLECIYAGENGKSGLIIMISPLFLG